MSCAHIGGPSAGESSTLADLVSGELPESVISELEIPDAWVS